jgi:hypothetical protein
MAGVPGGASGLLVRGCKGKEADRLVTRIAPDVISLVGELRGHERQAAGELGEWKHRVEVNPRRIAGGGHPGHALYVAEPGGSGTEGAGTGEGAGVRGVIDVQALAPATSQTAAVPTLHGASVQG